jgi:hypothetical protein
LADFRLQSALPALEASSRGCLTPSRRDAKNATAPTRFYPRGAGQPVDGGTITFIPLAAKQEKPAWAQIAADEYSLDASRGPALGASRAEIRWPRKTGRKAPYDPNIDEMREAVPDRYNRDSELQADVKPGSNQFDFAIHSR